MRIGRAEANASNATSIHACPGQWTRSDWHLDTVWHTIGVARGDVTVPADRDIALRVVLKPKPSELMHGILRDRCFADPEDLTGLGGLEPNDLGMLFVSALGEKTYTDERVIKPLSRLTGLKMLRLSQTGMTSKGMEYLRRLRSLQSLELSEAGIGEAGWAVLKDLPALGVPGSCLHQDGRRHHH